MATEEKRPVTVFARFDVVPDEVMWTRLSVTDETLGQFLVVCAEKGAVKLDVFEGWVDKDLNLIAELPDGAPSPELSGAKLAESYGRYVDEHLANEAPDGPSDEDRS